VELQQILGMARTAQSSPCYAMRPYKQIPYPHRSFFTGTLEFAVARVHPVEDRTSLLSYNVVFLARRDVKAGPELDFWCGDPFLEGRARLTPDEVRACCAESVAESANRKRLTEQMAKAYGSLERSAPCNFWSLRRRRPPRLCPHVQHIFASALSTQYLEDLFALLDRWTRTTLRFSGSADPPRTLSLPGRETEVKSSNALAGRLCATEER